MFCIRGSEVDDVLCIVIRSIQDVSVYAIAFEMLLVECLVIELNYSCCTGLKYLLLLFIVAYIHLSSSLKLLNSSFKMSFAN